MQADEWLAGVKNYVADEAFCFTYGDGLACEYYSLG